jgi:hypothetical protein
MRGTREGEARSEPGQASACAKAARTEARPPKTFDAVKFGRATVRPSRHWHSARTVADGFMHTAAALVDVAVGTSFLSTLGAG